MSKHNDIKVYDNGGESLDRYTVFPYLNSNDNKERVMYLGLSENGLGFSQWGEINESDINNLSFLGEEITFDSLSDELQRHILTRLL